MPSDFSENASILSKEHWENRLNEGLTGRLCSLENPRDDAEITEFPQRQGEQRSWDLHNNSSASIQHHIRLLPHIWGLGKERNKEILLFGFFPLET